MFCQQRIPLQMNLFLSSFNSILIGGKKKTYQGKKESSEAIIQKIQTHSNPYLISEDNNYLFQFDDQLNTQSDNALSSYLSKDIFTALFAVKKIRTIDQTISDTLILKVFDKSQDLDYFVHKWYKDIIMLPQNIPQIYLFGSLYQGQTQIGVYVLTKKYNDITNIF